MLTKILYITSEIYPFLSISSVARLVRKLAETMTKKKFIVRIIAPRFGSIKRGKSNIYQVARLSNINVDIGNDIFSLMVGIGAIKEAKLHVFFLDNEDLFERKGGLTDEEGNFYLDNNIRSVFFAKGSILALQKLEWKPDIVHCNGWFTSLVPMYLKNVNAPILNNTKCIYTLHQDHFPGSLGSSEELFKLAAMEGIKEEHFAHVAEADYKGLINLATSFADVTTRNFDQDVHYSPDWLERSGASYIPNDEEVTDRYLEIYEELLNDPGDDM